MITAEIYFRKRWSSINVKILRIIDAIQGTKNENVQSYLRSYAQEQDKIKNDDKTALEEYLNKIKDHGTSSGQPEEDRKTNL